MLARTLCTTVVVLCLCCSGAMAVPNLHAATGYTLLPDAGVGCPGQIDIAAAYERYDGTHELSNLADCHGRAGNFRVLGSPIDRFEIGGGYLTVDKTQGNAHSWYVGAKYQVYRNYDSGVAVAIGGFFREWSSDLELPVFLNNDLFVDLPEQWSAYLVLDKKWCTDDPDAWVPTTTVGIIYDQFDSTQQRFRFGPQNFFVPRGYPVSFHGKVASDNFWSPFFGVKLAKCDWEVFAEYRPRLRHDTFFYQDDLFSAAVRKYFGCRHNWAITAGVTTFNVPYTDSDPGYYVDFSYKFGQ